MTIRMNDLQWKSLASYLVWLEMTLELKQINSNDVWSVRIRSSIGNLWRKKIRVRDAIRSNARTIKSYVEEGRISEIERVVCVSLTSNYEYYCEVIDGQLDTLERAMKWEQANIEYMDLEVEEDVIPF